MLELESAAWKDDRRFRLLTFDNGTFSFTDLMFNTPGKPASRGVSPLPLPTPPSNTSVSGELPFVTSLQPVTHHLIFH